MASPDRIDRHLLPHLPKRRERNNGLEYKIRVRIGVYSQDRRIMLVHQNNSPCRDCHLSNKPQSINPIIGSGGAIGKLSHGDDEDPNLLSSCTAALANPRDDETR